VSGVHAADEDCHLSSELRPTFHTNMQYILVSVKFHLL
jgi:hypothetical protein